LDSPSREARFQAVRTLDSLRLPALDNHLARLAQDNANPASLRVEASRVLARGGGALASGGFEFLLQQLSRTNSATARLAANEVISALSLDEDQLTRYVRAVSGDPMISPQSVVGLVRRVRLSEASSRMLLDYLHGALSLGLQLSDEHFAWLATTMPAAQQERLKQLREAIAGNLERRRQQLAELEPLLEGGDPNRGHKLFFEKVACATCHRVGQQGGLVGPDLTKVGAIRSGRDLIESLVLPSATIAQGYDGYLVTLINGEELAGIRARQLDDALVLRDASGAETHLQPEQVQKMERLKLSLMPEGLLAALSREEIRDLLAYLQSLK
jgi:putative heme-binding domain-containing protein